MTAAETPIRIAMWSGPRNISTAMMRSFGNRPDSAVVDEPFYAAYLARTGIEHPLRAETLRSQTADWQEVVRQLLGPIPGGRRIFYQKHMTHHMLPGLDRAWMAQCRNAFLIRPPAAVLRSYRARRTEVTLDDIGFRQQAELFDAECDRTGQAPPVVDAADILADPRATLGALCQSLGIPFTDAMLHWPAGKRATDGVWAPAWYQSVERSTGFAPAGAPAGIDDLPPEIRAIAEQAEPIYERMVKHKI